MSSVGISDRQVGQYDGPYRRMIVDAIIKKNRKVSDVSRVFKIPAVTIYKWVQEFNDRTKSGFVMKEEKIEGVLDRIPEKKIPEEKVKIDMDNALVDRRAGRKAKISEEEKTKWVEQYLKEREETKVGPAAFIEHNSLTSYFYEWLREYKEKHREERPELDIHGRNYYSFKDKREWVVKYLALESRMSKDYFMRNNGLPTSFYTWFYRFDESEIKRLVEERKESLKKGEVVEKIEVEEVKQIEKPVATSAPIANNPNWEEELKKRLVAEENRILKQMINEMMSKR